MTVALDHNRLETLRPVISSRLAEFSATPRSRWSRELLFCLLTPQSTPFHAEQSLIELEALGLFEGNLSCAKVEEVLANPSSYVRFHKTKARRVMSFLGQLELVEQILGSERQAFEEREDLVRAVLGFGWKEASHALRNIGRTGLSILDRHILRNLKRLGVINSIPISMNEKLYKEIELAFIDFAEGEGECIDVLDLFFWASETGVLFK